jgi:hypothetical protein
MASMKYSSNKKFEIEKKIIDIKIIFVKSSVRTAKKTLLRFFFFANVIPSLMIGKINFINVSPEGKTL